MWRRRVAVRTARRVAHMRGSSGSTAAAAASSSSLLWGASVRATSIQPAAHNNTATQQGGAAATTTIDARTAEELRIAAAIGERGFDENTRILKALALRGARALLVCCVGVAAFVYARRYRQHKTQHEHSAATTAAAAANKNDDDDDDDPTQRYLNEMRSLGFDVDTLEEELAAERDAKAAAAAAAATQQDGEPQH